MASELITIGNEIQLYPEATSIEVANNLPSVPINRIASLGTAFEPIAQVLQQVTNTGQSVTGLYKVTLPKGATHLATLKNGAGNIGAAMNANNEIAGQAVLNPVALNPAMLFMAVTLANIDKKLDAIKELQKDMMDFLKQKEKSSLRGNLLFLQDLLEKYKFKWNDNGYKQSMLTNVLSIQKDAHGKIDFYTESIKKQLNKKALIHIQKDAEKLIHSVQDNLQDLQISQYVFGFSSFVETLLSDKYDEAYLKKIAEQINRYSLDYRELYTKAYDYIEEYTDTSVRAHLLDGAATISKGAGKLLERVPVISKTQIDENLQKTGDSIKGKKERDVDKLMGRLRPHQSSPTRPFIDSISMMSFMYNEGYEVLFDKKQLYITQNQEQA